MGERAARLARRGVLAAVWLAAGYYFLFGGEYSLFELRQIRSERDAVARRVDSFRSTADALERRAERLASDPFAIERTARERYGFIRDGEHLYRFVGSGGDRDGDGSGGGEGTGG